MRALLLVLLLPVFAAAQTNNLFTGPGSGNAAVTGSDNVGYGKNTLRDVGTGNTNTAVGSQAMALSKATQRSTAVGHNALALALNAPYSTAIGYYSLHNLDDGWYNTALGYQAGIGSEEMNGNANTAIGAKTLRFATIATNTALLGAFAGEAITSGAGNVGLGAYALWKTTTGAYNIAVGMMAGQELTTGSYNTIIGSRFAANAIPPTMSRNVVVANGNGEIRAQHDTQRWKLGTVNVQGTAPTAPQDGDLWATPEGLFLRLNGATRKVTLN